MKIFLKFLLAVILPLALSCSDPHLINDKGYRELVEQEFNTRKQLTALRSDTLYSIFRGSLSARQEEGLKFLYAFMPLSDLADYSGDFFLANVNASLRARDESPWGKDIPDETFLHYVLPCRVNNENLDSFRIVYYSEIMNRVKNLGMKDAALEINHWCHEKVNYQPADIRTSAPMSTIKSARGRCGEESTFTVAALRTAGIPARQVYTPRWAHTDDNHAWVEIWSAGKWYYMGACEPEPVIDRGWFTEPARRAMLIHTKSFGASPDGENAVTRNRYFTEVNNLSKYAVTKTISVRVTDSVGKPAKDAKVEYQLYNYAEFYPLAVVPVDSSGISRFETGLGDLLIWVSDGKAFNYKKISVGETDTVKLSLLRHPGGKYDISLDLDVPPALSPLTGPDQALTDSNAKRFSTENEIRNRYISTWITPSEIKTFASKRNIDSVRLESIFSKSMGNYNEIRTFLTETPDSLMKLALSLLDVLPEKDLRDTRASILSDHLLNTNWIKPEEKEKNIFLDCVLNPRVANEMLVSWRSYFKTRLPASLINNAPSDPLLISGYLEDNITLADSQNYYRTPLTPVGVNELKVSDSFSRDICFVAICRSLGIPARLEPGSNVPQYFTDHQWHDLYFAGQVKPEGKKGFIKLVSSETKPVPEYYTQFTLARFENGRYNTLEYDYNKKITDFTEELSVVPGSYMLVTGNRLPSGRILTSLSFFDLKDGEHKTVDVQIRKDEAGEKIYGSIDLKSIAAIFEKSGCTAESITGKGAVVLWIEPGTEPSKHIFNDIALLKKEFDAWGGYFLFLTSHSAKWDGFSREELANFPRRVLCGSDEKVLEKTVKSMGSADARLPVVLVTDRNGNIIYSSSGYRIGTGEEILKYIR